MKLNAINKCLPSKFLDAKVLQVISFELPTSFIFDKVFLNRGISGWINYKYFYIMSTAIFWVSITPQWSS